MAFSLLRPFPYCSTLAKVLRTLRRNVNTCEHAATEQQPPEEGTGLKSGSRDLQDNASRTGSQIRLITRVGIYICVCS